MPAIAVARPCAVDNRPAALETEGMLRLAAPTDPAWAARVLAHVDEILVDHAHCEKKAASSALRLLFRYPERTALLAPLSQLAREELAHFEEVLRHLERRGVPFRHQVPSAYADGLLKAVRRDEPARLLVLLLVHGLIEARSCERLGRLAEATPDPALADLWRGLLASEARHHQAYAALASQVAPPDVVRERLRVLAEHEAAVLAAVPALPRLHA
jgi:tRNA-(ms[2]io[6]A)-hydroxylase